MTKTHFIKLSSRATRLSRSCGTTEESRDLLFLPNIKIIAAALLLLALCACKVGPNYKRPALNVPDQYRSAPSPEPAGDQFAQMKWWTVFQDETLQALIKEALTNN